MSGEAYRHPKRGKAHRIGSWTGHPDSAKGTPTSGYCGVLFFGFEAVPREQVAPEDRCKVCWPPPRDAARPADPDRGEVDRDA